jgi:hypothetical protein
LLEPLRVLQTEKVAIAKFGFGVSEDEFDCPNVGAEDVVGISYFSCRPPNIVVNCDGVISNFDID